MDLHEIWHRVSSPRCNQLCQFFWQSVQSSPFCGSQILPSPLTRAVAVNTMPWYHMRVMTSDSHATDMVMLKAGYLLSHLICTESKILFTQ